MRFFWILAILLGVLVAAPCWSATQEDAGEKVLEEAATDEPMAPVNEAWEVMWSGQREMINEIRDTAIRLSESFSSQTANLAEQMRPFEEEGRRLLVFVNTFKQYPNTLEAVGRRLSVTIAALEQILEPISLARAEAQSLLERVNYMTASLPEDRERAHLSPEMQSYIHDITRARLRLTAALAQYDSLMPSLGLVKKLEDAKAQIAADLPGLWKNYYLQKPVPWLSTDAWLDAGRHLSYAWRALMLRLPVEMPTTSPEWSTAAIRFVIGLIFCGVLSLVIKQRWLRRSASEASRHMFKVSIPCLILGFAILGSAISATGDFFRLFLALGSMCVIIGEMSLAWDLRLLQYPDAEFRRSPFLRLLPLAILAYLLLYMSLPAPIILVIWVIILLVYLLLHKNLKNPDLGPMQLETGVREFYMPCIWICLFLAISGLQLYSMGVYLAYASISLAWELSLGGMAVVSRVNEHLPQEGARAVIFRLLVALAAPFVLVLAVAGAGLWILILPGGTYLISEYAFKGVTVGATQFNVIQVLLIISAFYLTRTVVAMGTRFLAKLPQQGVDFDATLITPLQTALTYLAWAVFGLFVLRSLGMQLSNLAMVAGGLSVGIGFGMQTIVNNFLSGLILIFGRTLQVGDVVEVGGTTGRVRKISVRATMVETYDNAVIYVPNSEFMSGRLINWTSFSRSVRKEVEVGVAYGSDTEEVIKSLIEIARSQENVLKYPVPSVIFTDFAASSLNFRVRFWVRDFELGTVTSSQVRLAINKVFAEKNIEIAFPQLDVHLKDVPQPETGKKTSDPARDEEQPKKDSGQVELAGSPERAAG